MVNCSPRPGGDPPGGRRRQLRRDGQMGVQDSFGGIEEIMIAEIEQIEESIIGSYAVEVAPSGEGYGGVIFGTIDGDKVKAFYLATRSSGGGDPLTTISFTDGRLVDEETIRGEFHYRDSDQTVLSGPYEAKRI